MRNYTPREETEVTKGVLSYEQGFNSKECKLLIKDTHTYYVNDCTSEITGENTIVTNSDKANGKLLNINDNTTNTLIDSILTKGFSVHVESKNLS